MVKTKILLVDDEFKNPEFQDNLKEKSAEETSQLITKKLQDSGVNVIVDVALNVDEALQKISINNYDFGICDGVLRYNKIFEFTQERFDEYKEFFAKNGEKVLELTKKEYLLLSGGVEQDIDHFCSINTDFLDDNPDGWDKWNLNESFKDAAKKFPVLMRDESFYNHIINYEVNSNASGGGVVANRLRKINVPVMGFSNSYGHNSTAIVRGIFDGHVEPKTIIQHLKENGSYDKDKLNLWDNFYFGPKRNLNDFLEVIKSAYGTFSK